MKMRKRIAALIAVAMIAALMPMTAFATSDNRVTKTINVKKDTVLTTGQGVELVITMKSDDKLNGGDIFALKLADGEWDEDTYGDGELLPVAGEDYSILRQSSSSLLVKMNGAKTDSYPGPFRIRLAAKITGDNPTVEIDPIDSLVSAGKYTLAISATGKAIVSVATAPTIAGTDTMAKITFDEPFVGAFTKDDDPRTIEVELRDSDFSFVDTGADTKLKGTNAYHNTNVILGANFTVSGQTIKITLPAGLDEDQRGGFILEGIKVKPNRNAREGDVKATLSGNVVDKQVVTVATYGDYSTTLKMEKDDYSVVAGKELEVEFTLAEAMANALIGNRTINFEFSKGIVIKEIGLKEAKELAMKNITDRYVAGDILIVEDKIARTHASTTRSPNSDINTNKFSVDEFYPDTAKKSSYTFEATLLVPAGYEGDITLTAEGRGLEEKKEVVVAETEAPVTVEATTTVVKVGIQKQETDAKIIIKETKEDRIKKGEYIRIRLGNSDDGIEFASASVKVTEGDLELDKDDIDVDGGVIIIPVKRHSTEPSTIEITEIAIKTDRTVPQGSYDVKVGGAALSDFTWNQHFDDKKSTTVMDDTNEVLSAEVLDEVVKVEDFIVVGTPNTEDINKGKKAVVSFTIGSNKFLIDGKEMEMDAAAYIKDGRTMVPLRYLASALGIEPQSIKFNAGIVTIFDVAKVIQVQVGSKNLVVNSVSIPMVAAAEIIDGRTYIPVTEIGSVFGVSGTWDAETQTATFK